MRNTKFKVICLTLFICMFKFLCVSQISIAKSDFFVGSSIELTVEIPLGQIIGGPFEAIVDENIEFYASGSNGGYYVIPVNIDISENTIFFDYSPGGSGYFSTSSFNGYVFTDKNDTINDIKSVTIIEEDTSLPITPEMVSYNNNQIFINVSSLYYSPSSTMKLAVEFYKDVKTLPWIPLLLLE